jgi:hypothetical protein
MWMIRRLGIASLIIGLIPVLLFALIFVLGEASGCMMMAAAGPPCVRLGINLGGLLIMFFIFASALTPPAAGVAILWIFAELVHFLRGPQFPE